jgi:succinyl-diaminopimelate desuccinylase
MSSAAGAEPKGDLKKFVDFYNTFIAAETDGASLGLAHSSEKFGRTTVNAGLMEGTENFIKVTLDCRYPADHDFAFALEALEKKAEEYGIECSLIKNVKPLYVPEDSVLVKTLQDVYAEQTGQRVDPVVIGGGTYAKAVKNIVAFGPVFPGQENVIHQKDEYITIEHLMKNIEIMSHAIHRLGLYTF